MSRVYSSHILEIGYDAEAEELHVRYAPTVKNPQGDVVVYREMDAETANDILTAPSIGAALHADVRGKYPFKKL